MSRVGQQKQKGKFMIAEMNPGQIVGLVGGLLGALIGLLGCAIGMVGAAVGIYCGLKNQKQVQIPSAGSKRAA
jgi:hypothetical protein